jgi:hypothetical protein
MAGDNPESVVVRLSVTVHVDPSNDELLDRYDRTAGSFSIANVVSDEVRSNLESVSYVRHVSINQPTEDSIT